MLYNIHIKQDRKIHYKLVTMAVNTYILDHIGAFSSLHEDVLVLKAWRQKQSFILSGKVIKHKLLHSKTKKSLSTSDKSSFLIIFTHLVGRNGDNY